MLLLLLLSCGKDVPLSEIEVESADLTGISMFTGAVIGGGGGGAATLEVTDVNGRSYSFPVALRNLKLGAVVEVDNSIDFGQDRALVLPGGVTLTADQLLGRYRGVGTSVTVGAGVQLHNLRNRHEVEIDKAMFSVGVGVFVGWETLHLALGNSYGHEYDWEDFVVDDTGAPPEDSWPDTAPGDSGFDDSGFDDSGFDDTSSGDSAPDDSGGGVDSGGGRSGGCGSGPSELDDSGGVSGDDSGGSAPPPSSSGCEGGGCSGSSSSGGCLDSSSSADCGGCGTTGGGRTAPWTGLLALVLLRRRP